LRSKELDHPAPLRRGPARLFDLGAELRELDQVAIGQELDDFLRAISHDIGIS
jgi:hypothetical protein